MRVINFPSRGIGDRTLDQVREIAQKHESMTGQPMSLLEAASTQYQGPQKNIEKFDGFVELLSDLYDAVSVKPLPDFIEFLIERTGLLQLYESKTDEKEKDRSNNMQEMINAASRFCEESTIPNASTIPALEIIGEFLTTATLESAVDNGKDGVKTASAHSTEAVTLMTVHSSKGLEFDSVFIGGADETVFPLARSVEADGDEEERRLMYVAITRGRKDLYMTTRAEARIYGEKRELLPSRFIYEIADEYKAHSAPEPVRKFVPPPKKNWGDKSWPKKPDQQQKPAPAPAREQAAESRGGGFRSFKRP
jgi:DNA helicase II / ATP-dependent DNA helicase PcrA